MASRRGLVAQTSFLVEAFVNVLTMTAPDLLHSTQSMILEEDVDVNMSIGKDSFVSLDTFHLDHNDNRELGMKTKRVGVVEEV